MGAKTEHEKFVDENISNMLSDGSYFKTNQTHLEYLLSKNYHYNFEWFGRPIIQLPQDIYAVQNMVWQTRPDLIIECGIAHGGSIVLSASLMAQLDMLDAMENSSNQAEFTVRKKRHVVGIDIDIREHNKRAMEAHQLEKYWTLVEGSSIDDDVINAIGTLSKDYNRVMVLLDSNHTHDHVLQELKAYAPLVSKDCYLVVWDSGLEDLSDEANKLVEQNRPWGRGNNPKTAMLEYLESLDEGEMSFEDNKALRAKIGISAASDAFLLRKT
ncbi:CmcI family methyltransferase [Lentilitoribacter sp. Alg239-R112]|uniref:cephalosporin hydroxylase family protein n=1 Tax=Lentilitoribacter sp. Alg239-R112 TaxID=2305987 RepID=UPI0018D9BE70|nr:CmcI family methyltransferase [Lentilitoribacter sp. Alg239-R112]